MLQMLNTSQRVLHSTFAWYVNFLWCIIAVSSLRPHVKLAEALAKALYFFPLQLNKFMNLVVGEKKTINSQQITQHLCSISSHLSGSAEQHLTFSFF